MRISPIGTAAALALLCASACSILPKAESPNIYLLPPPAAVAAASAATVTWSLRVGTPTASGPLDSNRIAVVPDTNRITVYKGARWSDRATVLVRDRLIDAFRSDGRIGAVGNDDGSLRADRELDGQLRSFQSEYDNGTPTAVIRYDAQLIDTHTHRLLASRTFQVRHPATGKEVPHVVEAFGQASDELSAQVVAWATRL
jgi:cholesterol transport system auxiliary component